MRRLGSMWASRTVAPLRASRCSESQLITCSIDFALPGCPRVYPCAFRRVANSTTTKSLNNFGDFTELLCGYSLG